MLTAVVVDAVVVTVIELLLLLAAGMGFACTHFIVELEKDARMLFLAFRFLPPYIFKALEFTCIGYMSNEYTCRMSIVTPCLHSTHVQ